MARTLGKLVRSRNLPLRLRDIGRLQRNITTATILVDEQIEFVTIDISTVGAEGSRAFDRFRTRVFPNTRRDGSPAVQLVKQARRALLDDVGAAAHGSFVLGEAVVGVAGLDDGGVDACSAGILPDLWLAKCLEILGGGIQHAMIRVSSVGRVALLV